MVIFIAKFEIWILHGDTLSTMTHCTIKKHPRSQLLLLPIYIYFKLHTLYFFYSHVYHQKTGYCILSMSRLYSLIWLFISLKNSSLCPLNWRTWNRRIIPVWKIFLIFLMEARRSSSPPSGLDSRTSWVSPRPAVSRTPCSSLEKGRNNRSIIS